jgi:hypothetical protein
MSKQAGFGGHCPEELALASAHIGESGIAGCSRPTAPKI